ncbi:hypothetical protein AVEN_185466-1 [Araneus ventricosus]|uniref:Uncharacterized protein n=1 Tax=Araneus ventricosus TaxID=182803 RepID=A0A4Y2HDK7_ARAVE|nr:hypothetical protein AVEN_185466-1 [Araneus ventricosus]
MYYLSIREIEWVTLPLYNKFSKRYYWTGRPENITDDVKNCDKDSRYRCLLFSAIECRVGETEMNPSCADLNFFHFKNATEKEDKEIQNTLKSPPVAKRTFTYRLD